MSNSIYLVREEGDTLLLGTLAHVYSASPHISALQPALRVLLIPNTTPNHETLSSLYNAEHVLNLLDDEFDEVSYCQQHNLLLDPLTPRFPIMTKHTDSENSTV